MWTGPVTWRCVAVLCICVTLPMYVDDNICTDTSCAQLALWDGFAVGVGTWLRLERDAGRLPVMVFRNLQVGEYDGAKSLNTGPHTQACVADAAMAERARAWYGGMVRCCIVFYGQIHHILVTITGTPPRLGSDRPCSWPRQRAQCLPHLCSLLHPLFR